MTHRVYVLSVGVQVVRPSELGLGLHAVDGRWLGLPGGHLGHVVWSWHVPHHVAPGKVAREICLLLLSLPSSAEIEFN